MEISRCHNRRNRLEGPPQRALLLNPKHLQLGVLRKNKCLNRRTKVQPRVKSSRFWVRVINRKTKRKMVNKNRTAVLRQDLPIGSKVMIVKSNERMKDAGSN